jgi:prephenate dehydratase
MTKIQSVPMIGEAWRYIFFIDFILEKHNDLALIIDQLSEHTVGLKILGEYREGTLYDS